MLFNSFPFLIFFPAVVLLYYVIPKKARYLWLLVASYVFYMWWNPTFALLIAFTTLVTYGSGILMSRADGLEEAGKTRRKKWIVAVTVVVNLLILVFFKYFDFLLENLNRVLGLMGSRPVSKSFDVLLPVGISFYTFQALGYTLDVYRGKVAPERNVFKYALFVAFFPQILAGPIGRAPSLLPQVNGVPTGKPFEYKRFTNGLLMMMYGYFLKMVVADRIAILVNTVYDSYFNYGAVELIVATVAFAVQIYCDFASYSTIAVGAAEVMGFHLIENFNTPYFAVSIQDFWRRWHISLSTWFKDYLYIPLGGNRCSRVRKYCNIMVVFLVSGLWHGASWTFLIWGFLHGAYQIIGEALRPLKQKLTQKIHANTQCGSYKGLQMALTFVLVCVAWVFFRASSVTAAFDIFHRLFIRFNPWVLFDGGLLTLGLDQLEINILMVSIAFMFLVDLVRFRRGQRLDSFLDSQNLWFKWLVAIGLIVAVLVYGQYGPGFDAQKFIYLQF